MKKITTLLSALTISAFGWQAQAQYCAAGPSSTFDTNVESVNLTGDGGSSIAYTGCPGVTGVENLTATQTVDVTAGSPYTADIQFGTCGGNYGAAGEAWIDWNQDFTFDPSESIGTWSGTPPTTLSSMAFTVPALAVNGNTVLRVMQQEGGSLPLDPCGTFTYGSVADFTIVVSGGVTICNIPSNLAATNILSTSADLGWIENGAATVWDIEMDTAGFTPTGTPTTVGTTTNPTNATGLMPNTSYEFYVRASCGPGDSSAWAGPLTFKTLCVAFTAPFSESFDNNTTPDCWMQSAITGGPWVFGQLGSAGYAAGAFDEHTGNGGYYTWMDFSTPVDNEVVLELPIVDISASNDFDLSFVFASHNTSSNDSNILYVEAWDGSAWGEIAAIQQDSSEWVKYSYTLTGFTFGTNLTKIRFRAEPDTSASASGSFFNNDFLIDDVRISETCNIPTSGVVSDLTSSSASLGWATTGTSAASWSIEYGPTGFTQGTGSIINGTTLNPHPLVGLVGGTGYDYYIISNCALGDQSPWAGPFSFTTYITGVDGNSASNGVSIFPNPSNGIFTLEVNADDATVKVMNTQGQIILTKNILTNNAKIDLSNNAKGIYFVTVTSENGVSTHKVTVQ